MGLYREGAKWFKSSSKDWPYMYVVCVLNWSWLSRPDDKSTIVCTVHGSHPSFIVNNIVYVHLCGCCLLLLLLLLVNQNGLVSSHGQLCLVYNIMELLTRELRNMKLEAARRRREGRMGDVSHRAGQAG